MSEPADIVRDFCAAWRTGNLDAIMEFFTPDAVYHNIPMAPVQGTDGIRATIESFSAGVASIEFEVLALAATGNTVLTERVDKFNSEAKTIALPVMGAFEIVGEKIAAWRDYFDLNQFMTQLAD